MSKQRQKPKNFLITGISGLYGGSLLRLFSEDEPSGKLVGVDIKNPQGRYPFLDFRKMDIRDQALAEVMKSENIDTVVHMAFAISSLFAPDEKVRDVNINGTRNVLDCAVAAGVGRFVQISSTTAYGAFPDNEDFLGEDVPVRAIQDFFYTRDKVEIDHMVDEYREKHPEMKFVVIRPSIITGRAMHHMLQTLLKIINIIPVPAGLNPLMQFVHEEDLARATRVIMESDCQGIYNVTGDGGVPFHDMLRMMGKRPLPVRREFMLRAARSLQSLKITPPFAGFVDLISYPWTVSNEKLRREFDFTFEYDSRAAFAEFVKRV